jgi:hypothetical protein
VAVTTIVLFEVSPEGERVTEVQGLEQVIALVKRVGPSNTAMVLLLTVAGLSDLENIRVTMVFKPRLVDMFAGVADVTAGAVVSTVFAVVNEKLPPCALLPT